MRLRKRWAETGKGYSPSYKLRWKRASGDDEVEQSQLLTPREYNQLLLSSDPARERAHKKRTHFLFKHHVFELDEWIVPGHVVETIPGMLTVEVSILV